VGTTEHNRIKEKSFTKKKTESLGNWQCIQQIIRQPRQEPHDSLYCSIKETYAALQQLSSIAAPMLQWQAY
jgi:hypothetical protein